MWMAGVLKRGERSRRTGEKAWENQPRYLALVRNYHLCRPPTALLKQPYFILFVTCYMHCIISLALRACIKFNLLQCALHRFSLKTFGFKLNTWASEIWSFNSTFYYCHLLPIVMAQTNNEREKLSIKIKSWTEIKRWLCRRWCGGWLYAMYAI